MDSTHSAVGAAAPCLGLLLAMASCEAKRDVPAQPTPVTVVVLRETNPSQRLRLAGSAEAWRQESIGFEVGGRLVFIAEEGTEVAATPDPETLAKWMETWVVSGGRADRYPGWVLARINPERYFARMAAARAELAEAWAREDALVVRIERVLVARLEAAEANMRKARIEFESLRAFFEEERGGRKIDVDRAEASYDVAKARVREVQAGIESAKADLVSVQASIKRLEESLRQVRLDVEECVLVAPFAGQVSTVRAYPGAVVAAGTPVLDHVIMDPIKVVVAVSPAADRRIRYRDAVNVYPPGRREPTLGLVWLKDTVADPVTRTFKVQAMIRNYRVAPRPSADLAMLPRIADLTMVARLDASDPEGPLAIQDRALVTNDLGEFVWRAEKVATPGAEAAQYIVFQIKKVRVLAGKRSREIFGFLVIHELEDPGPLLLGDQLAIGVPKGVRDGGRVVYYSERWLVRPGDIVDVDLAERPVEPGFFVPVQAIYAEGDDRFVFAVEREQGGPVASRLRVSVTDQVGELVRIEAPELGDGLEVVVEGSQYLVPGSAVQVIGTVVP